MLKLCMIDANNQDSWSDGGDVRSGRSLRASCWADHVLDISLIMCVCVCVLYEFATFQTLARISHTRTQNCVKNTGVPFCPVDLVNILGEFNNRSGQRLRRLRIFQFARFERLELPEPCLISPMCLLSQKDSCEDKALLEFWSFGYLTYFQQLIDTQDKIFSNVLLQAGAYPVLIFWVITVCFMKRKSCIREHHFMSFMVCLVSGNRNSYSLPIPYGITSPRMVH